MSIPTPIRHRDDFSRLLKARRGEKRLRQEDLANLNRMSRFTLTDAENGKADPKLSTMITLLRTLGLTLVAVPSEFADRVSVPQIDEPDDYDDIDDDLLMGGGGDGPA
ncbi:helix-turn-helix domain-containing protein [Paracoccus sp. ME4]|uniref:helix-turn-helix domain-containing protein n=1 Tax=Paracoccus sp. ME4 TaxID=3138066 RepID=UPI00398AD6C7